MPAPKRIAAFLALLLAAGPALADPFLLIANALGVSATAVYWGAAILFTAGTYYQAQNAKRRARNAADASLRDRTITVRGSVEPRRVVLGRQMVGGVDVFHGSTGANKEKFVVVVVFAGHEGDAIDELRSMDIGAAR